MMALPLGLATPGIEACFEGLVPATIGSVSEDGVPNVTWLSIVQKIDDHHVGLSRQFFRKTKANFLSNQRMQVLMIHPDTGRQYRLNIQYAGTETEGPKFEWMRTQLEAIASQEGMTKVFRLAGIDVCRVLSTEEVPTDSAPVVSNRPPLESSHERLSAFTERINGAGDVEDLIERSLEALDTCCGYPQSFLLLVDEAGERLYTIASRGYGASGAGSEVRIGDGQIGVAAERRRSVLVTNLYNTRTYTDAIKSTVTRAGRASELESEIPLPGLPNVASQLAVPVMARGELLGVLCVQSEVGGRLLSEDEHIVNVAASQIGLTMALLRLAPVIDNSPSRISPAPRDVPVAEIRHYPSDDSIFIDNDYLIKGTAGRILWRLLHEYLDKNRVEFSNKEMRLDTSLDLPDIKDNLEARLILLRRRLEDQCGGFLSIVRSGRGRFRLSVGRPFTLTEAPA
jgi:adenylate cyclase